LTQARKRQSRVRGKDTTNKTETDFEPCVGETPQAVRARPEEKTKTQMPSHGNHELELKELEALRFSARAARAITTLEVQRKTITREYGERIKKIKALILLLQQRESMGQLSIEGMDAIEITPELRKLIYNPVGDLS
jgi:predicted DNA-binding protein (UPF0251 family)